MQYIYDENYHKSVIGLEFIGSFFFLHNNDSKKSYSKYESILSINNVKGKHIKLCVYYLYLLNS